MNKSELQKILDERGVFYPEEATNKQLETLLAETEPKQPETEPKQPEPEQKQPEPEQKQPETKQSEPKEEIKSVDVDLRNTLGEKVDPKDYFFEGVVLPSFEKTCGKPVDREDLLGVFNKTFKPKDNILFYKQPDKEVYLVIVPIKNSVEIGEEQNSITGDFQKHAISFLNEGQVNLDSLKKKLDKIKNFVSYPDR